MTLRHHLKKIGTPLQNPGGVIKKVKLNRRVILVSCPPKLPQSSLKMSETKCDYSCFLCGHQTNNLDDLYTTNNGDCCPECYDDHKDEFCDECGYLLDDGCDCDSDSEDSCSCPSDQDCECGVDCDICNDEYSDEHIVGCCNNGSCPHNVENLCKKCGNWDEKEEVWRCPSCNETHLNSPEAIMNMIPKWDVPTFSESAEIPEIPHHGFRAFDVNGDEWWFNATKNKWVVLECHSCAAQTSKHNNDLCDWIDPPSCNETHLNSLEAIPQPIALTA